MRLRSTFAASLLAAGFWLLGGERGMAAPANDAFAQRLVLGPLPVAAAGDFQEATIEPGEPSLFIYAANRSLWWSWTAEASLRVVITNRSRVQSNVAVLTGETLTDLQTVARGGLDKLDTVGRTQGGGTLAFAAVAGQTYQLRFDPAYVEWGAQIQFGMGSVEAPSNDDFARRIPLVGEDLTVDADNVAALAELGEGSHFLNSLGRSLWWSWTAPQTGRLTLQTSYEYYKMAVYEGTTLTNLARRGSIGDEARTEIIEVHAGHTYQLAADAYGYPGSFQFTLKLEPRSSNDDFANRRVLSGASIVEPYRTVMTTREAGEPSVLKGTPGNSLWWSWTAPGNGLLVVDAAATLGVFSGDSLSRLRKLALDHGRVSLKVAPGNNYAIVVDAPPSLGTRELALHFYQTPSNDSVSQPTPVVGTDVQFSGDTRGSTGAKGEPKIHPRSRKAAVWYSWVAPATGHAVLATVSTEFTLALGAYRKETSGALTRIGSSSGTRDFSGAGLAFTAEQGRTYLFGVDSLAYPDEPDGGAFQLRLVFSTLRLRSPPDGSAATVSTPVNFSITSPLAGVDGELAAVKYALIYPNGSWTQVAVASNAPFSVVASNLPVGRASYAAFAETLDGQARFTPPHTFTVRPANDDFTNRLSKPGYQWVVSGVTDGASTEPREPAASGASLWYSWRAPSAGPVTLTYYFNNAGQRLTVHTGDSLPALKTVKLKRNSSYGWEFTVVEGQTYHFAVRDSVQIFPGDAPRSYTLQLEARTVGISSPTNGVELREPLDLPLAIRTTENRESILRVEYLAGTNLIASATNAPYSTVWSNAAPGSHMLVARVVKTAGESPSSPPVSVVIRPRNDSFANATVLTGWDQQVRQTTRAATREAGEPDHGEYRRPRSTWWKWTAPDAGRLFLTLAPIAYGTNVPLLIVYSGDSLSSLTGLSRTNFHLAPNFWDRPPTELSVDVVAGRTYSIVSAEVDGSDLEFTLGFRPSPLKDQISAGTRAESMVADGTTLEFSGNGSFGQAGAFSFAIDFQPTAFAPAGLASEPSSATSRPLEIPFGGEIGANYRIETSTNLTDWVPFATNRLERTTGLITVPEPGRWPARFYRITRLED